MARGEKNRGESLLSFVAYVQMKNTRSSLMQLLMESAPRMPKVMSISLFQCLPRIWRSERMVICADVMCAIKIFCAWVGCVCVCGGVINCHRNVTVHWVGMMGGGWGCVFLPRGGAGGSSSVTGIHSVVRAPYLSASLNQFHAEVS